MKDFTFFFIFALYCFQCEDIYYKDCEITNSVMRIIGWHNAVGMNGVTDDLDVSSTTLELLFYKTMVYGEMF